MPSFKTEEEAYLFLSRLRLVFQKLKNYPLDNCILRKFYKK